MVEIATPTQSTNWMLQTLKANNFKVQDNFCWWNWFRTFQQTIWSVRFESGRRSAGAAGNFEQFFINCPIFSNSIRRRLDPLDVWPKSGSFSGQLRNTQLELVALCNSRKKKKSKVATLPDYYARNKSDSPKKLCGLCRSLLERGQKRFLAELKKRLFFG